jgi:site-specific recombinase XerD
MTMTMRKISEEILKGMEGCNLLKSTIKDYTHILDTFNRQAETSNKSGLYSLEVIELVLNSQKKRLEAGEMSSQHFQKYRKTAFLLGEYTKAGAFVWGIMPRGSRYFLNNKFFQATQEKALTEMRATTHFAPQTLKNYRIIIRKFCFFLEYEGISSFSNLTIRDVIRFIESTHDTNKGSIGLVIHNLKTFVGFLNHQGLCTVDANIPILIPITSQEKNIIYFTKEEVHTLLESFTFAKGELRDYAILLLAIHTGMRRSDICNLRLQDISWEYYTIDIRQKKTGRKTTIPLIPSAGNALADYILHERPQTTIEHIFLTARNPIRPLKEEGADAVVKRRCKKAGVAKPSKCTIHSFRRYLGTWI